MDDVHTLEICVHPPWCPPPHPAPTPQTQRLRKSKQKKMSLPCQVVNLFGLGSGLFCGFHEDFAETWQPWVILLALLCSIFHMGTAVVGLSKDLSKIPQKEQLDSMLDDCVSTFVYS